MRALLTILFGGLAAFAPFATCEDVIEIDLGPEAFAALDQAPRGTRLVVFFQKATLGVPGNPADGPFPFDPAPIASWGLEDPSVQLDRTGARLHAGTPSAFFPVAPQELEGTYDVQAVFDLPSVHGGHRAPGDLFGPPSRIKLDPTLDQTIQLSVDRTRERGFVEDGLFEIELESKSLPRVLGLPAKHRAWVALPQGYDDLRTARRTWPTVYFIPDHGSALDAANSIARLLMQPEMKMIMPQAIWVVLDPDGPTGHHYFTDSPSNGSRSRALVEELIPWLEIRFRAIPDADARVLFGIGAGGRAAMGLFMDHPTVFSWEAAISPEAISFSSIGMLNLYKEKNAFRTEDETPRVAVRSPLGPDRDRIHASIEDEVAIARAISPKGFSGTRWDAMRSAFGATLLPGSAPPWPFDPESGEIDPEVVSGWQRHDLVLKALGEPELVRRMRDHGCIVAGARDQWYRELGVISLDAVLGTRLPSGDGDGHVTGFVEILPNATADVTSAAARLRIFDAMIEHLQENDLHD